ncbi:MAG TPA: nuclear transport factor 2 family protein [Gemmatimonadaceae bacterium]|nr:nuclear transport factor 2 family protein [Gemmatimonadaceae bacterium]
MSRFFKFATVFAFAFTVPIAAHAQIGRGGDQPAPNAVANAYRSDVRNRLNQLVIELAGAWDATDPKQASNLYTERGTIILGPELTIEGRKSIRAAFGATLRHMRGVVLTIDDYDMSGELAFVRGTMIYEILHEGAAGTQETVTYTMILRRQRNDEWLIQSHMIAGNPVLPPKTTGAAAARTNGNSN